MHKKFLRTSLFCLGLAEMTMGTPNPCVSIPFKDADVEDHTESRYVCREYDVWVNDKRVGTAHANHKSDTERWKMTWLQGPHRYPKGTKVKVTRKAAGSCSETPENYWIGTMEQATTPGSEIVIRLYENHELGVVTKSPSTSSSGASIGIGIGPISVNTSFNSN